MPSSATCSYPALLLLLAVAALAGGCRPGAPAPPPASGGTSVRFRDVAREAGVRFQWGHGGKTPLTNLETFGCGCAFLDANEDGWLDLLLVGEDRCGFFLAGKSGKGTFEDATAQSGIGNARGTWKGCAVGDADGDGHLDVLLTGYNAVALLRGDGRGGFTDVTRSAGLPRAGWGSSAGFMDLDGDGDLDLVLGNYVIFNDHTQQYCELAPGVRSGCPPQSYLPQFARLFRNDGGGRFTDVSREAGMGTTHGKALVVAFSDYDQDGKMDFYLGNDGTPADLMRNRGNLRFENAGYEAGVALGVYNQAQAAMGADWGDFDRDGQLDLVTTAFSDEPYSLYRRAGALFENVSPQVGLAVPTLQPLGFGAKFVDAENDGWLDLVFANGHVYDAVDRFKPGYTYRQPLMFFANERGQSFRDRSDGVGADFRRPLLGRGLATGDYDNDGRVDLLVVDYEGEPLLLHNETANSGHWLGVELRADRGNRYAYGARVTLRSAGQVWVQELSPASSYLSSSSPILHFGLGGLSRIETVEVRWPGGERQVVAAPEVDRVLRVRYGPGGKTATSAK